MTMAVDVVTIDTTDVAALSAWWATQTGTTVREGATESFALIDDSSGVRIGFRLVDAPTPGKNRAHLDMVADDYEGEVDRLLAAGASLVGRYQVDHFAWSTLTDPEGNEFCLSARRG